MKRIDCLKKRAKDSSLLITNPIDLYYFTGLDLSAGKLLVSQEGVELFVDGRYFESATRISPIPVKLDSADLFKRWALQQKAIEVDSEKTSVQAYLDLQKLGVDVVPVKGLTAPLRSIKDEKEIALLKEAAELGSQGFDFVVEILRPGIREDEVAFELETFWRKRGAKGVAFEPIIAFGANSSMPHYRAGSAVLKENQPVLIDIGVTLNHYHSDMTRMAVLGKLSEKMDEIFQIVKEAHERAVSLVKPGISVAELDDAARLFIASKGYGDHFSHSLGHGIGLDVHEFPTIRRNKENETTLLKPGMVITIEPGIYISELGGVRLEDTLIVTDTCAESITKRPLCCHSVKKYS